MIDYKETIDNLKKESARQKEWFYDGEATTVGNGYQYMRDAITLLQQYREGLEWVARVENVTSTNGLLEVQGLGRFARKTLEGKE